MPGVISTGSHPRALWPGIHAWWGRMYSEHKEEFPDLFDEESSDQAYEEDVEITGFGLAPQKIQGETLYYDSENQGAVTRYTHVAYALGYIVTYEELRDNLYASVSKTRAKALAFSMRQTKENVGANVYNRAFNATYTYGDTATLISTAHPTFAGNQSNQLTTAADLSELAIEDLVIQIMQVQNNRGLRISALPRSLHIPVQLTFEAQRILKSVLQSNSAENNVNVLRAMGVFPDGVKPNHYFTSATAWFIRTNVPNGMRYFNRESASFDQDNDFDTKNAKAACYERYSFGMTDFRGIFGTAGV